MADPEYDGLSLVVVEAVTADIDGNIQPGNIKKGVTILGVTGTLAETSAAPSNMVTTDSAQTISGAKTFTKTTTFQNDVKANGSVGTSGQVLVSQGAGKSPKWGDAPAPSNVVTTDTAQTITGSKTFTEDVVAGTGSYPRTVISKYNGVEALFSQTIGVRYYGGGIQKLASAATYTISIPNKTGTMALTSDIPTLYLAQGVIVTQGGDSFYTPAIPCLTDSINWTNYSNLFPEGIPVNIIYRSGTNVILVTSFTVENGTIRFATEVNLTTGVVTEVTDPQDYSLDELIVNKVQ